LLLPSVVRCYRGRGAFESMGAGLHMEPGDIAFKSNFATLDPATGIVVSRRADRRFEDLGPVLCDALDGEPRIRRWSFVCAKKWSLKFFLGGGALETSVCWICHSYRCPLPPATICT
jgi:2,3-bisphosphoglycerate-independent phosphoglycerate mutase